VLRLVQARSRRTGRALLDEDFLREEDVTDFSAYACVPGTNPPRLAWTAV
jgi:citronellol/citronellal dehydrogenase